MGLPTKKSMAFVLNKLAGKVVQHFCPPCTAKGIPRIVLVPLK